MGFSGITKTYYNGLGKVARDLSASSVPAFVSGRDMWLRNWFAFSVCIPRYKNARFLVSKPCFALTDFSFLESLSSCTLFFDQIECLNPVLQEKLLEYIVSGFFEEKNIKLVIGCQCGINKLADMENFNKDLFFKLSLVPVKLIELNERKEDVLPLAEYFLEVEKTRTGKQIQGFSENAVKALNAHYWRGFETELKNAVERACLLCEGTQISENDLNLSNETSEEAVGRVADELALSENPDMSLKTAVDLFKKVYITRLLEQNDHNQTKVAKILDVQRTYVSKLLSELNIR